MKLFVMIVLTNHVCFGKRQVEASMVLSGEMLSGSAESRRLSLRAFPYLVVVAPSEVYFVSTTPSVMEYHDELTGMEL